MGLCESKMQEKYEQTALTFDTMDEILRACS